MGYRGQQRVRNSEKCSSPQMKSGLICWEPRSGLEGRELGKGSVVVLPWTLISQRRADCGDEAFKGQMAAPG